MDTPTADQHPLATANLQTAIEQIAESIRTEANVRAVFGDPLKLDERTVIPIATVTISLGGGMGLGRRLRPDGNGKSIPFGAGGGGGLDVKVVPLGFIAEHGDKTEFVPIVGDNASVVQRVHSAVRTALRR